MVTESYRHGSWHVMVAERPRSDLWNLPSAGRLESRQGRDYDVKRTKQADGIWLVLQTNSERSLEVGDGATDDLMTLLMT